MIQIDSIRIEEFRGIREMKLDMRRRTFVVCGPNGSGKSGIVDAIQFALTGEIGRLKGAGTGDLKLVVHGPHVERRARPDLSSVSLGVFIPHLGKTATISRTIAHARQPRIAPEDDDVKAVFTDLATRPEITLARREIIKLILTEATQRSRDVQTLLQMEGIDATRAVLKTTENKLGSALATAKEQSRVAAELLGRHLGVAAPKAVAILSAVNLRRRVLGLPEIETLSKDTCVSEGIAAESGKDATAVQGKESVLADIRALTEALSGGPGRAAGGGQSSLLEDLRRVENEPGLLAAIKKRAFLRAGIDFVDGPLCPLCDAGWKIEDLRAHLAQKLERTKQAEELEKRIGDAARVVAGGARRLRSLLDPLIKLPEMSPEGLERVRSWSADLQRFSEHVVTLEGAGAERRRLEAGWAVPPDGLEGDVQEAMTKVQARPEKDAAAEATAFLAVAQARLGDLRGAKRAHQAAAANAERGRIAYKAYCETSERILLALYQEVEADFASYYSAINQDDESEFKATFSASEGKLGLLVDFHKKGMFPPGAYHSEGHQDGMGVCLYLALLKRVLGSRFTLAVLDDVVMSVDSQHRRRFCKLLKTQFPDTQFVITTHDEVWARQMRSDGLVDAKSTVAFNAWSVETGPVWAEVRDVWDQIASDLAKHDVPAAAGRLRRHFEYVSRELAHSLGAKVPFRADGAYDLGQLLSAVLSRQSDLLKNAAKAARSWGQTDVLTRIEALKEKRSALVAAQGGEQWAVNKAIHYNEWLNLTPGEFHHVVTAFRGLIEQFRCQQPGCDSWLFVTPAVEPADLRCDCGDVRLNLREK